MDYDVFLETNKSILILHFTDKYAELFKEYTIAEYLRWRNEMRIK